MSSPTSPAAASVGGFHSSDSLADTNTHEDVTPGEIAAGVIIGRSSEYFDFFVFGIACVLVFPYVFFSEMSLLNGMLTSFTIFALAFIARPFGTAISMLVQRRWGRGVKMTIAIVLLGTATVGIAMLPSYKAAGTTGIWLLVALRIIQGMALGGSWDGLPSLLALSAQPEKRGWYSMIGQLGAPVGFVAAAGLFAYLLSALKQEEFIDWGWRYPFFVAFAINVVALFARLRLIVGQNYTRMLEKLELNPAPSRELLRSSEGRNVLLGALAALASFALFHLVTVFPLSWMMLYGDDKATHILSMQAIGACLAAGSIIISGKLADTYGRRNTLGTTAVLIGLFSLATPFLLQGGSLGHNTFILLGFILLGLSYGQSSGTVTANFSRRFRYVGAAYSNDLAWLLGAAFAPLVALGLSAKFGPIAVALYLLSGVACTLAALGINRAIEARGSES